MATSAFSAPAGATGVQGPQGATGQGVPVGGTAGQFLSKNSGTDYDAAWKQPAFVQGAPAVGTSPAYAAAGMGGWAYRITPTVTGRVMMTVNFSFMHTGGAGTYAQYFGVYGTGTSPAAGAALTGSNIPPLVTPLMAVTGISQEYGWAGCVTGLAVGTNYWFDIFVNVVSGPSGTAAFNAAWVNLMEF